MNPTLNAPFLPELPDLGYLSLYRPTLPETADLCEQALALLFLHLPEQAAALLNPDTLAALANVETESVRLLALEQTSAMSSSEIAQACAAALECFGPNPNLLEMGLIHSVEGQCFDLAVELMDRYADTAGIEPSLHAHLLHNHACALTALGRIDEALEAVSAAMPVLTTPADLLMDPDLDALWETLANGPLTARRIGILQCPVFQRVVNDLAGGRILRTLTTAAVQTLLPPDLRSWMIRSLCSHWKLDPTCPADLRQRYFSLLDGRRRERLQLLRFLLEKAASSTQPTPLHD